MGCNCGKRKERLAAKRAVTASARTEKPTAQQFTPKRWSGKPKTQEAEE